MKDHKPFYVFRYSLVEESQRAMHSRALPEPKGAAIMEAISSDREFSRNGVEYAFIGFKEAKPTPQFNFPEKRFFIGKTAKHGKTLVGERVPGDIVEYVEDDWIPIITIFDIIDQYIFVQKDWRFGTESQAAGAIEAGVRAAVLSMYNHRVFVEPVTHKERFWQIIDEHSRIYKVQLNLISPNILETNRKARDALKALEDVFNQDEAKIVLESQAGNLKVPEDPIGDYVDYIAEGEGSWKVVADGGPRGGKKAFSSKECVETIDLPVESDSSSVRSLFDQSDGASVEAKLLNDARRASEAFTWTAKRLRRS